ncbi:hypothetical protein JCM6882_005774 [Rhodosporidiobolus microsporus]
MRLPAAATSVAVSAAIVGLSLVQTARAYIPAVPTNDTSSLDSSDDLIHLAFTAGVYNARISRQLWQESFDDEGNYSNVSSVVPWTKYNKGVLIHFDESLRTQSPASVPWIAMISCDTNGTAGAFSNEDDIFTIVRDLGAEAALLYSTTSQGCQITNEYLTSFEKVLDVFATTTLQAARIIEQQFINVNSAAYQYDSATLNASASVIQTLLDSNALSVNGNVPINSTSSIDDSASTVQPTAMTADGSSMSPSVFDPDNDDGEEFDSGSSSGTVTPSATVPSLFSQYASPPSARLARRQVAIVPPSSSSESSLAGSATRSSVVPSATSTATGTTNYLGAVMAAGNLTVGGLLAATPSASSSSDSGGGGRSTGLAMIILYAITGVVCLLFLVVILSGAIRALRHPERYGPRGAGGGVGGAGGAGGQTRAAGLTRAILDTFPVVRFGGDGAAAARREGADEEAAAGGAGGAGTPKKDVEGGEQIELASLPVAVPAVPPSAARRQSSSVDGQDEIEDLYAAAVASGAAGRRRSTSRSSVAGESFHSAVEVPLNHRASVASLSGPAAAPQHVLASSPSPSSSSSPSRSASSPSTPPLSPRSPPTSADAGAASPLPALSAGATAATLAASSAAAATQQHQQQGGGGGEEEGESCPICFTEFEEGDELRVLPCDQRHIFHTGCIDPWLLEVSSSCPLCRLDLASTAAAPGASTTAADPSSPTSNEAAEAHEEERVIRHLRALLHRGAQAASAAGNAGGMGGGAIGVPAAGAARASGGGGAGVARAGEVGVAGEGADAGMRGRFARYVAARRERVRVAGVGVGRRRRGTTSEVAEGVPA